MVPDMEHWCFPRTALTALSVLALSVLMALMLILALCRAPPAWATAITRAPASTPAASPGDVAATHAYLEADYAWVQAELTNVPASSASLEAFAGKLAEECKGAIASVLPAQLPPSSPRKFGEYRRESEQRDELEGETLTALSSAWEAPDRPAASVLAAALMSLQWSSPAITQTVRLHASVFEEQFGAAPPDVCADIKAWVASGYKTLSAGTKALRSRKEAVEKRIGQGPSIHQLVAPYEGAPEKALIKKTGELEREVGKLLTPLGSIYPQALRTLGFPSFVPHPVSGSAPKLVKYKPSKDSVVFLPGGLRPIAHGRAPGGPAFSIIGEHYRWRGHKYFAIQIEVEGGEGGGESESGQRPKVFSSSIWTACKPHPYAIVYGLLKAPRDGVLARYGGRLRTLRQVRIPASFHAGGRLVYAALPGVPGELLVRAPSGRTLISENLGGRAKDEKERCEGETEG